MIFFVVYVKKRNFILWQVFVLALNIVFFTHVTQQVNFSWNDFVNFYHMKMYVRNFYFKLFDISKLSNMHFEIKGTYAPMCQNITPVYMYETRKKICNRTHFSSKAEIIQPLSIVAQLTIWPISFRPHVRALPTTRTPRARHPEHACLLVRVTSSTRSRRISNKLLIDWTLNDGWRWRWRNRGNCAVVRFRSSSPRLDRYLQFSRRHSPRWSIEPVLRLLFRWIAHRLNLEIFCCLTRTIEPCSLFVLGSCRYSWI
jgi:hypothetical protein